MNFPQNLKYTNEHEWIRVEGDIAYVGITDYAQEQLGDIVFVDIPTVGETLEAGETFGTIEVVKTISDLFLPVAGEVLEQNEALEENPELKGAMFIVCDQPGLTAATFARMLDIGKKYPGKIVCAGRKGKMGNPVLWDRCFFDELSRLSGDKGGKQIIGAHMDDVLLCETEETELRDVDIPEQLTKWERDYGKSGKSGEET